MNIRPLVAIAAAGAIGYGLFRLIRSMPAQEPVAAPASPAAAPASTAQGSSLLAGSGIAHRPVTNERVGHDEPSWFSYKPDANPIEIARQKLASGLYMRHPQAPDLIITKEEYNRIKKSGKFK
jgi:hypothetical protein